MPDNKLLQDQFLEFEESWPSCGKKMRGRKEWCGGEWKTYSDAHFEGLIPVPTFLSYSFGIIIKVRPRCIVLQVSIFKRTT